MKQSHRLIHNTCIIWIARLFRYIPELFLLPFVLKRVGDESYGVYVLAWSILIALERIHEPVTSAVIKYNAGYIARGDFRSVNSILSSAFNISVIIAVVSALGIMGTALLFPDALGDSPAVNKMAVISLTVVSLVILTAFPITPHVGVMYALQRHDLFFILDTVAGYLKAAVTVLWFIFIGPSIAVLIIVSGLAFLFPRIIMAAVAGRTVPGIEIRQKYTDSKTCKTIFSFGGILFLASLCYFVNFAGMKWLMGVIITAGFVAHMEIMLIPSRVLGQISHGMTLTVMPVASRLNSLNDSERLNELFIRGSRYITILIISEMIAASLLVKPVLLLWMGKEYMFLYKYLFVYFCFNATHTAGFCANQILRGKGELKAVFINSFIGQAMMPVLVTFLYYCFSRDAYWSVTVGLSSGALIYGLVQIFTCRYILKTPLPRLLKRSFIQPLVPGVPVFFAGIFLSRYWEHAGILFLIPFAILLLIIFMVIFYLFFSTSDEKKLAVQFVSGLRKKTVFKNLLCFRSN